MNRDAKSSKLTFDVYRGKMRAVSSMLDVACFIGFFPQMVAGPIVRASAFLPQLQSLRKFSDIDVRMICQGASERNISFLVDESKAEETVRRLHRLFFPPPAIQPVDDRSHALCQAGESWI